MTTPSSNILAKAFRLIGTQTIQYERYEARAVNDIGLYTSSYADPVPLRASVQAVPKNDYQALNLDFNKEYVHIFCEVLAQDIGRDRSSDRFTYGGRLFQVLSSTNWHSQDGWVECLCVRIGEE